MFSVRLALPTLARGLQKLVTLKSRREDAGPITVHTDPRKRARNLPGYLRSVNIRTRRTYTKPEGPHPPEKKNRGFACAADFVPRC